MPIRPENRARYPADWWLISKNVRADAGNKCEGSPAYPECRAENAAPHPVTGARVILTVAHLDHHPENCARVNLRAWCQRCHNTYDAPHRAANRKTRAKPSTADARGRADGGDCVAITSQLDQVVLAPAVGIEPTTN